jgi:hypothetical protein
LYHPSTRGFCLLLEGVPGQSVAIDREETMKVEQNETRVVLQVGSELRIKNNGDIIIDNPELELIGEDQAADAVLLYRFDPKAGEHVLRLVDPVANHKHLQRHRPED